MWHCWNRNENWKFTFYLRNTMQTATTCECVCVCVEEDVRWERQKASCIQHCKGGCVLEQWKKYRKDRERVKRVWVNESEIKWSIDSDVSNHGAIKKGSRYGDETEIPITHTTIQIYLFSLLMCVRDFLYIFVSEDFSVFWLSDFFSTLPLTVVTNHQINECWALSLFLFIHSFVFLSLIA